MSGYAYVTPDTSLPFYDHNPDPIGAFIPNENASVSPAKDASEERRTRTKMLKDFLRQGDWDIEDARDQARRLGIDLQQEPKYSRMIFDKLPKRSDEDWEQLLDFLGDPFLNTRGSGNYAAAVEWFTRSNANRGQIAVMDAISRALELGLISSAELLQILKSLPKLCVSRTAMGFKDRSILATYYDSMWKAIGRCNILGHAELDKEVVDAWLEELHVIGDFDLAGRIMAAAHNNALDANWPTLFLLDWLDHVGEHTSPIPHEFLANILGHLDPDCAARCLIDVTEALVSSEQKLQDRNHQLEMWRDCLLDIPNASAIGSSQAWSDLPLAFVQDNRDISAASSPSCSLSVQHQIIVRLWTLRSISHSLEPLPDRISKATDRSVYMLLSMYETTVSQTKGSFLADLVHGIHELSMPYNALLLLATNVKLRKLTNKNKRQALQHIEKSKMSLTDALTHQALYEPLRVHFHGVFEQMTRQLDLTSPESVEKCLRIARSGDLQGMWSIIRLLQNHTPFKIALNKAWVPLPSPEEMALVRYHPGPRDSQCPDPYAAVDFIHRLAVTFSCCERLEPRSSFRLVHTLYDYLRCHGGPVHPSLVQAMYHAGVVRFRRKGYRVTASQFEYIMWIISKFEGRDVVRQLSEGPQIGEAKRW